MMILLNTERLTLVIVWRVCCVQESLSAATTTSPNPSPTSGSSSGSGSSDGGSGDVDCVCACVQESLSARSWQAAESR